MDKRLEQALDFSNFRHTQTLEKRRLQEKLRVNLTLGFNGGTFFIDRNLIVFLNTIMTDNDSDPLIILDEKMIPILIDDPVTFRQVVISKYISSVNQYYYDYESLKKKRSATAIIDL